MKKIIINNIKHITNKKFKLVKILKINKNNNT